MEKTTQNEINCDSGCHNYFGNICSRCNSPDNLTKTDNNTIVHKM